MLRTFVFASLFLASIPPSAAGAGPDVGVELTLELSEGGLPVLWIEAPGEIFRFAVDTGTSRTMVSARVAASLGLVPSQRIRLASATGQNQLGLCGPPPRLILAGVDLDLECLAWVPEEHELAGSPDVDGLLGSDALAGFDLWLDAPRRRARAAPPGSLLAWIEGDSIPLEIIARRPAIRGSVGKGQRRSPPLRLILDSGANATILFGTRARQIVENPRRPLTPARVETPAGSRTVQIAELGSLRSGSSALEIGPTILLPEVQDRQEDGLLPLGAFGPLLLSVPERLLVHDARWRRTPRFTAKEVLVAEGRP